MHEPERGKLRPGGLSLCWSSGSDSLSLINLMLLHPSGKSSAPLAHTCTLTHTHTHAERKTHTHRDTHTHTHTHTHTQAQTLTNILRLDAFLSFRRERKERVALPPSIRSEARRWRE